MTPYYSSFSHLAEALDAAGATGLVLFNRFYQSPVDTRTMTLGPQAELSTNAELPLRLHWLAPPAPMPCNSSPPSFVTALVTWPPCAKAWNAGWNGSTSTR